MSIGSTLESPSPTIKLPPQSRKQKRLSKHFQISNHDPVITILSTSPLGESVPLTKPTRIPRALTSSSTPSEMRPSRLLIASIGNPAPYLSTLHSAGHTVLSALASSLNLPLQKSSRQWANGLLAQSDDAGWTLWASPVNMNISGSAVSVAWKTFVAQPHGGPSSAEHEPKLVVLHDDLEMPLGSWRVRPGSSSPQGHNGLKSIREKIPGVQYTRIGIGIGRPESREPAMVAGYVLRKMTALERGKIEGVVGGVWGELRRLSGE